MSIIRPRGGLLVLAMLAGCGGGTSKSAEPAPTLTIESAQAVVWPDGETRIHLKETHTPYWAAVLIDGAKEQQAGFWPLADAKRTPGKHSITIEVVRKGLRSEDPDQRTTMTVDLVVAPKNAEYVLRALETTDRPKIRCNSCTGDLTYGTYDKQLKIDFRLRAVPGDTVTWEGRPLPSTGENQEVSFSLESGFADLSVARLLDPYGGITLPLVVTTPDGGTALNHPYLDGVPAAIAVFDRPTYEIGDPNKAAGADRNVLILSTASGLPSKLVGVADKIRDVDLIALVLEKEAYRRNCGSYKNDEGNTATHEIMGFDIEVRVFDRRSRKTKGQQLFRARPATCPHSIFTARPDSFDPISGRVEDAEKLIMSFVKS
ncbi:MAG: hypothetical protein NT062_25970 [Proteobacteria bacterium]|nr:hypothetical protein [Pseudomonadota bacterium]